MLEAAALIDWSVGQPTIPVYRPNLPPFRSVSPYLATLDDSRIYSNFGALGAALAGRLGAMLNLPAHQVVMTSSGTAALVGAILAIAGRAAPKRRLCLVPSYTFSATALAAELCGYQPYFVDVDDDSWMTDPAKLSWHPMLDRAGLVIPVLAYGAKADLPGWERFQKETGIPVIVDGAAAFEQLAAAPPDLRTLTVALSFHATKAFATGEGGAVLCYNPEMAEAVYRSINFGMLGDRACRHAAINGKMSEYHAAVGLAELDGWDKKSRQLHSMVECYRRVMAERGVAHHFIGAPDIASCYALYRGEDAEASDALRIELGRRGIEHRFWYGYGLHREPYFADAPKDDLPVTDRLSKLLVGLPIAPDFAKDDMIRVADAVAAVSK